MGYSAYKEGIMEKKDACKYCKFCKPCKELTPTGWNSFYVCIVIADGPNGFCMKLPNIETDMCETFWRVD